jgi:exoribonuclease R
VDPGYPPFVVGSKDKPAENWFCTVEFVSWTDEWPRGAIQERLGPVGDAAVERRALVAAASIPESKAATGLPVPLVDLSSYKDEPWDSVFHIDPVGCEDVDDILAWRDEADGSTTWLIGIADVAAWIPEGSPLDRQAFLRAQTLYDNGVPVSPMLPHILSTGLASLRSDGVKRPVVGLRVAVSAEGAATVGGLDFYQVAVTETYTYESVQGTDVGKRVRGFASSLSSGKDSADSHEWIETVMVAYNVHVARSLRSAGQGLLRRLPASEAPYAALSASTGCAELEHLGRQAGEYCAAASTVDVAHAALGLSEYCHASSPLRRYADLVNQRVLHHRLRGAAKPAAVDAAYLNYRASVLRRTERDLWFLSHLARSEGISETEGILLTESSAYCPEWKRVLRVVVEPSVPWVPGTRGLVRVFVDRARPRLYQRTVCAFVLAVVPLATEGVPDVADTI